MFDAWRISWTVLPSTPFDAFSASPRFVAFSFSIRARFVSNSLRLAVVGAERLLVGQQIVAGEAVLDLHYVADGAELLDALQQDNFHGERSLLHDVGKQADVAGALDGAGQLTLLLGRDRGDPRGDDLAALGYETLEQADVLVIDAGASLPENGQDLRRRKNARAIIRPPLHERGSWAVVTVAAIGARRAPCRRGASSPTDPFRARRP